MSEEQFKELYKNVKKEQIIEELYCKCEANKELYIGYERLNNIINELEEEISRHIALCTDVTLNDILEKLKELKEKK